MFNEFLSTTQSLYQNKKSFAIAFVVNRKMPSSGKPGDKAVIQEDGKITGWIGGGCTRGIVLKEAYDAIKDGKPRLVRISPDGSSESLPGVTDYKMTCNSGGTVEIYIEPVLPRPQLLIMGRSHVAMALSQIAKAMDYTVTVVAKGATNEAFPNADIITEATLDKSMIFPNTCIVVSTQGEYDEDMLEQALNSEVPYVSFIASRKKANAVFSNLRKRGITFDQLKKIKTPAGLDIKAKLPEEVAISIIAEIIQYIRTEELEEAQGADQSKASASTSPDLFINPVCGIPVEKSTAKHIIEYEGENYYFCCDGCKVSFEKEPQKYT